MAKDDTSSANISVSVKPFHLVLVEYVRNQLCLPMLFKISLPLFLLFSVSTLYLHGQDTAKIWKPNREFHYQALYLDANGDTISNETIVMVPTGEPNPLQKKTQTLAEYRYYYSHADSVKLAANPIHANDFTEKYNTIIWRRSVKEGIEENEEGIWIHPFRINQYVLTEIAPFPAVRFPLTEGRSWKTLKFIGKGWGTFRGRASNEYTVKGRTEEEVGNGELVDCQLIEAVSNHKKLGESQARFYFHPDYGFVEMDYHFFNGQRMVFSLQHVVD